MSCQDFAGALTAKLNSHKNYYINTLCSQHCLIITHMGHKMSLCTHWHSLVLFLATFSTYRCLVSKGMDPFHSQTV